MSSSSKSWLVRDAEDHSALGGQRPVVVEDHREQVVTEVAVIPGTPVFARRRSSASATSTALLGERRWIVGLVTPASSAVVPPRPLRRLTAL